MKKRSVLPPLIGTALIASSALAVEILETSRAVQGFVDVSDRVEGQWCSFAHQNAEVTPYSFSNLCSVDTGYGFGEMHVALQARSDPNAISTIGEVTADALCDEYWPAAVTMGFDWDVIEDFRLAVPHEIGITGHVNAGPSLMTEYANIAILEGADFTDAVWSISVAERSTVQLDEQFVLAAGDYRFAFRMAYAGGSTCDVVRTDFDVTATLTPAVSVTRRSFSAIKGLYR